MLELVLGFMFAALICSTAATGYTNDENDPNRHLIVLSPPKHNDWYYEQQYHVSDDINAFLLRYAKEIMHKDNVVIVGNYDSLAPFRNAGIPDDVLLYVKNPMEDIWMRDFTTMNPYDPFQLRYSLDAQFINNVGQARRDADYVQRHFRNTFRSLGASIPYAGDRYAWVLDGGNLVDNYKDKIIVTSKFSWENYLSDYRAIEELQYFYKGTETNSVDVAIIPWQAYDDLGHADGMVSFIDDNVIAVTSLSKQDYEGTIQALNEAFVDVTLVDMPDLGYTPGPDPNFASACGVSVNAVFTKNYLYLPVFGDKGNPEVVKLVEDNTSKTVVPVNADGVCDMGGSVRCLSWQQTGENAKIIIQKARQSSASNVFNNPLPRY